MGEPAAKIKADDIASVFREEIRNDVESLKAKGVHPTLVGFLGTGDVAAKKYSEWTMKACEADGIRFEVREVLQCHDASVGGLSFCDALSIPALLSTP